MFSKLDKFTRVHLEITQTQRAKDELKRQNSASPTQANMRQVDIVRKKACCDGLNLTSFVLLIALSTHAFFEGIALGLTKDMAPALNIMVGLLIHKTVASMSLGISIANQFQDQDLSRGY